MDQNYQQPNNQQGVGQVENDALQKEAKKNIARKRIFWTIFGIDVALLIFLLYEIISLFF